MAHLFIVDSEFLSAHQPQGLIEIKWVAARSACFRSGIRATLNRGWGW
jgi:hypothetical protein